MMVLATVLGAGSVLLFAASGRLMSPRTDWPESTVLLWDAALSLAFLLQHSVMVRRSFHARIARVIPDHYTARFGDAYRDYQRRVPMLIPWRRPVAT
jgi:hypothetical protein